MSSDATRFHQHQCLVYFVPFHLGSTLYKGYNTSKEQTYLPRRCSSVSSISRLISRSDNASASVSPCPKLLWNPGTYAHQGCLSSSVFSVSARCNISLTSAHTTTGVSFTVLCETDETAPIMFLNCHVQKFLSCTWLSQIIIFIFLHFSFTFQHTHLTQL